MNEAIHVDIYHSTQKQTHVYTGEKFFMNFLFVNFVNC